MIQCSFDARISKRSSALFIRQFEIYFFRNLRAKKHSASRCFAYHATIAETYRLYENKPVRNAHSSEERFEYKDCYNLNALVPNIRDFGSTFCVKAKGGKENDDYFNVYLLLQSKIPKPGRWQINKALGRIIYYWLNRSA